MAPSGGLQPVAEEPAEPQPARELQTSGWGEAPTPLPPTALPLPLSAQVDGPLHGPLPAAGEAGPAATQAGPAGGEDVCGGAIDLTGLETQALAHTLAQPRPSLSLRPQSERARTHSRETPSAGPPAQEEEEDADATQLEACEEEEEAPEAEAPEPPPPPQAEEDKDGPRDASQGSSAPERAALPGTDTPQSVAATQMAAEAHSPRRGPSEARLCGRE